MALYDRDYMKNNSSGKKTDGMNMLWILIAANVIVFLLGYHFILKSYNIRVIDIIGSIFSHESFSHLFFNMFSLFIFGSLIARRCGFWKFLGLYLSGGIIGNLLFMLLFKGQYMLLGASGAVFGIMMATAMMEPDREFFLIFMPFFGLKTKTLVTVFTVIELFSQFNSPHTSVAHWAHLGGFLGGYLFMLLFLRREIRWNPLKFRNSATTKPKSAPNVKFKVVYPQNKVPVSQKELDYLLDKISEKGINSLTEEELARLKQAREQMQGR